MSRLLLTTAVGTLLLAALAAADEAPGGETDRNPFDWWPRTEIEAHARRARIQVKARFQDWLRARQRLADRCPHCHGKKKVVHMIPQRRGYRRVEEICPRCDGTGTYVYEGPFERYMVKHHLGARLDPEWGTRQKALLEELRRRPDLARQHAISRKGGSRGGVEMEILGDHALSRARVRLQSAGTMKVACEVAWAFHEGEWLIVDPSVASLHRKHAYPETTRLERLMRALRALDVLSCAAFG